LFKSLFLFFLGCLCFSFVSAEYPDKNIRLIVPFAPGAGADAIGRHFGQKLTSSLNQPVVIENRAGANGLVGLDALLKSPPDGYTIALVDRSVLGINPSLYKKLTYDPLKDLEYLGIVAWAPYLLVVHPSIPIKNLSELIKYTQQKNEALDYASFGNGSLPQLDMELLKTAQNIKTRQIPYKGAAPAISATIGGEVSMTLSSIGSLIGNVKDGRLKAIVLGASKRSPLLPDVPTILEAVMKGTPIAIKNKLSTLLQQEVQSADTLKHLQNLGMEAATAQAVEMESVVKNDIERFKKIITALDIQQE
jgi:tripartite-type tricarboxylate transporter receptor subunit TctC